MNTLIVPLILLGMNSQALCEPDAEPNPSPVADASRKVSAVRPVITRQPLDEIETRGRTVTINCGAEGYPFPQISWLKNGVPFKPGAANAVPLPNGLMFYNLRTRDEGVYQCLAANTAGTARSRNATLRIAYIKDDFRTIPEDVVAAVGVTAELRCEGPRGVPEPTISWKKNERKLSVDGRRMRIERGKLIITDARKSDSGPYQCVASNDAGVRTSVSVLLSVHEPPVFTVKPTDQTVVAGNDLELLCEARGDPKPRIRWTKPESVQPSRVMSLSNGNLRITNAQEGDAGRYKCSAENIVAQISATVNVVVNRKPRFIRQPKDATALVGDNVSIPCWAEGKPVASILWRFKGGTNMFPGHAYKSGRFVVQSNGDLTVYNVQFEDQGEFTCDAYNSIGPISATARLTVISRQSNINPPVIKRGPRNVTVALGGEIELKCLSSSVPAPDLKWTKDGSGDVRSGGRFVVTTSGSLKISSLQNLDAGRYTCTATNDFGWSKWDAWLKVAAEGTPVPDPDDARNAPGTPGAPLLVNATSTSITLRWRPGSRPRTSSITGYILEYYCRESEVSTWNRVDALIPSTVYTVRGLKPSTSCVFLVRTQSQRGNSDPSEVSETYKTLDRKLLSSAAEKELREKISQISVMVTRAHPLTTESSVGIRLDWDSSAYCNVLDGFKISLQPVSVRKGEPINATTACFGSTFELDNLLSRVVYEIRIQPYKGTVTGRPSPIFLASPESEGSAPDPPVLNVDTKSKNGEEFVTGIFTWTAPPDILPEYVARYVLRCSDKSNSPNSYDVTKHVSGNVTSVTLSNLPRGRDYTAFVYYDTLLGEGARSQTAEFLVKASSDDGMSGLLKNPGVLAGIVGCIVALLIAIVVGVIIYRRRKRSKKSRGLHGRARIPLDSFSGTQYTKSFTMSVANQGGSNSYSDGTGSSSGNPFLAGLTAPPAARRNTTVALNNGSNGNIGTSLSGGTQPVTRHASSFSYVADQLTSMSNIQPHFSRQHERTPTQALSDADLQLLLQRQQQYQRQISGNPTILAGELSPHSDLIDMTTPTDEGRYAIQDEDLPPPPPSPPMSQKTSLSDRTNRSRGSSRNSAERGSNHSKGRRSRERARGFQPLEKVPTDTDTGIDSPQQTPSPPRPSDMRAEHYPGIVPQTRGRSGYPYSANHDDSRRRVKGEYGRNADPGLGYLGGPSEYDTESEVGARHRRPPLPEDVRNSVTASSVSMMNRYDSESACSYRSRSLESSVESLNMESASQIGVSIPQHVASPNALDQRQQQYNGGPAPQRAGFAKPKPPKKHHGHCSDPQSRAVDPSRPGQFENTVKSSSSSGSSSYRQNTADSGMSAGVGSFGGNSMNSSSSVESGEAKGPMSRSRTTGSISAENQLPERGENVPAAHFASADRRYLPDEEYKQHRSRAIVPQQRCISRPSAGHKSSQRNTSQDTNVSFPPRDGTTYIDYDVSGSHDTQPMLPACEYGMQENDTIPPDESRTAFLAAKSIFAAPKPVHGRHPELSNVPEASTSDFCEDYSDRSH